MEDFFNEIIGFSSPTSPTSPASLAPDLLVSIPKPVRCRSSQRAVFWGLSPQKFTCPRMSVGSIHHFKIVRLVGRDN